MLTICLRILSILGILLLVLLTLAATAVLLVLFCPVTYRIRGTKDEESLRLDIRIKWLAGLLRVRYQYPEPGHVTIKLLCFPLYKWKKGIPGKNPPKEASGKEGESLSKNGREKKEWANTPPQAHKDLPVEENAITASNEGADSGASEVRKKEETVRDSEKEQTEDAHTDKNSQKFEKIKYTFHNIYDKIKKIWDNISYYRELLLEEESRLLFSHIQLRLVKILKSIRPRIWKANILFGTGSPDTTGYLYGVYCMFSPVWGIDSKLTPDFEEKVFQGEFELAGHVVLCVLLMNAGKVLLDKRLKRFLRKLKREKRA